MKLAAMALTVLSVAASGQHVDKAVFYSFPRPVQAELLLDSIDDNDFVLCNAQGWPDTKSCSAVARGSAMLVGKYWRKK